MSRRPIDFVEDVTAQLADGGGEPLLVMDGYDDCIVGVARRFNDVFVVYDREKVIQKLVADGMTEEEADEFFEFNQVGAWSGRATPAFMLTDPGEAPEETPDG